MRFEQVLKVYWTKGFLFGGHEVSFQSPWRTFAEEAGGMGITTRRKFVRRYELFAEYYDNTASFETLNKQQRLAMNYILSLMTTVNHQLSEIQYWNLIRLYFIKCFKGRAQALGKPSNGQRTWSNAWTAYNYNKTIRQFVNKVQTKLNQEKREEKINYKLVKKKFKKNKNDGLLKQPKKKPSSWF